MTLPLPNLDDRTFDELMAEARAMIPALAPGWTNFNESDPGMVLVELFAWLTEMLLYQVDQVPQANTEAFLALLNAPGWQMGEGVALETAVYETITRLRHRYRAVTLSDYEALVRAQFGERVARVRCVAGQPGHIRVVIVPQSGQDAVQLRQTIANFLEPRRLLTVNNHVVEPVYLTIWFTVRLVPREDVRPCTALERAKAAICDYFDPLHGGPAGDGWPFGRAIYRGDLFALLDQLPEIDYVERLLLHTFVADEDRRETMGSAVTAVHLQPGELVRLDLEQMVLLAIDADGREVKCSES